MMGMYADSLIHSLTHSFILTLVQQGLHAFSHLSIQTCISLLFTGEMCDYLKATSIFSTQFPLEFTSYIMQRACQNWCWGVSSG